MNKPPQKLLDQVREQIRLKHYSICTEQAYPEFLMMNLSEIIMD